MKFGIKCFIALIIVAMTSFCVSASDTTTTFKTGPFTGSVDLGMPCYDINISEPRLTEKISGASYTYYKVTMCGTVTVDFARFDKDIFDWLFAISCG